MCGQMHQVVQPDALGGLGTFYVQNAPRCIIYMYVCARNSDNSLLDSNRHGRHLEHGTNLQGFDWRHINTVIYVSFQSHMALQRDNPIWRIYIRLA